MLTAADIRNRTLKTTMGGYNKKDTDEFIASILEVFEELSNENRKLKEQLTSLSDGIQYYKNLEDNLQKALILAEKTSDETKNAAKVEAANIVSLAKSEASDIVSKARKEAEEMTRNASAGIDKKVSDAQHKADDLSERLSRLTSSFEKYKRDIKALVENQLEFIESEDYSVETPVFEQVSEEVTNADDVVDLDDNISENVAASSDENDIIVENILTETDNETPGLEDIIPTDENINAVKNENNLFKWETVSDDDQEAATLPETDKDTIEIIDTDDDAENKLNGIIDNTSESDDDIVENENSDDTRVDTIDNDSAEYTDSKEDNDVEEQTVVDDDINVEADNDENVDFVDDDVKTDNSENSDDDIIVENIMTTPTLDGIEGADISNTVFPTHKPDKNTVSYLAEHPDENEKQEDNKNPFTFIDLD